MLPVRVRVPALALTNEPPEPEMVPPKVPEASAVRLLEPSSMVELDAPVRPAMVVPEAVMPLMSKSPVPDRLTLALPPRSPAPDRTRCVPVSTWAVPLNRVLAPVRVSVPETISNVLPEVPVSLPANAVAPAARDSLLPPSATVPAPRRSVRASLSPSCSAPLTMTVGLSAMVAPPPLRIRVALASTLVGPV